MCGICGKVFFDRERTVDPALLERMMTVMAYRGPDDAGTYLKGRVGFGHRTFPSST